MFFFRVIVLCVEYMSWEEEQGKGDSRLRLRLYMPTYEGTFVLYR